MGGASYDSTKNEAMEVAADSLFIHNTEQNIRDLCRARQDVINHERRVAEEMARLNAENKEQKDTIEEQKGTIEVLQAEIEELKRRLGDDKAL